MIEKIDPPSWMMCYFMLANRILLAAAYLELDHPAEAREVLEDGKRLVRQVENHPWIVRPAVKDESSDMS